MLMGCACVVAFIVPFLEPSFPRTLLGVLALVGAVISIPSLRNAP